MTTNTIRRKLTEYIQDADPKKLKAIFTLLQDDVAQREEDEEIDDELLAELDRRSEEMISGKAKTYSWKEVEADMVAEIRKVSTNA